MPKFLINKKENKKEKMGSRRSFCSGERGCCSVAWTQPSQCGLIFKGPKEDLFFSSECLNKFFSVILAGPNKKA